jgi:tetratricopeptide (TPR) repeat protein
MFQAAKTEFSAAIERDSNYAEAYNALGFTEEGLGDDNAAPVSYEMAIKVANQKGQKFEAPYINLAAYYNRLGQPDRGLEYANKALELNPKSDLGYYQVARACQLRGEWEKSAEALRSAIAINGKDAQYFYVLGQVYRKLGKTKESADAMEAFQKLKHDEDLMDQRMRAARAASAVD